MNHASNSKHSKTSILQFLQLNFGHLFRRFAFSAILEILKAHVVNAISDKAGPGASTRLDKFEVVEACRGPELVLACKHGRGNAWDGVFREVDVWQPAQHKNGEEKM